MTDPIDALNSFQEALLDGKIVLQRGDLYPDIYLTRDEPILGKFRFTYLRLENTKITALVNFAPCAPIQRIPSVQIGYAVPEEYRKQGRAKEAVRMAIAEMKNGFQRAGVKTFFIEAIIGADNISSQIVAAKTISETRESIVDEISGVPAFRYLLKID